MDAYMVRTAGGAPAARGEDACQEQDRVEQDGDMDCDQQPSDDIEPVVTNSDGHKGYNSWQTPVMGAFVLSVY